MTSKLESLTGQRLYVIDAKLLFSIPEGEDPQGILDTANMLLIPLQRCELDDHSAFLDYSFQSDPLPLVTPALYDYDAGFGDLKVITVPDHELSAEGLRDRYSPNGEGEHPKYMKYLWQIEAGTGNTELGYWDWVEAQIEQAHNEEG